MKERPIIFSTDMVKAILEGRKTQTRRVIKPQPNPCRHKEIFSESESGHNAQPDWHGQIIDWKGYKYEGKQGWFCYVCGNGLKHIDEYSAHGIICPYGQVGDRLWVREACKIMNFGDHKGVVTYKTTANPQPETLEIKWRPSIFMPRWASRITLEITEVRVERLREIAYEDCYMEGVSRDLPSTRKLNALVTEQVTPKTYFKELWDSLNAKRGYGWEVNPWVWVISFKRLT